MSVFQICYASRATAPMKNEDLSALLQKARINNHSFGLTGLLLYDKGSFIQLLEGPQSTVLTIYEKIRRDPRHDSIQILFKNTTDTPSFPQWDMGFCDPNADSLKQLPGYSQFFQPDFSLTAFRRGAEKSRLLFIQFRDGLWRRQIDLHPINAFSSARV